MTFCNSAMKSCWLVMDYRGLGGVNAVQGAASAKWIHCGIIIDPYLDEHRSDYYYSRFNYYIADDANSQLLLCGGRSGYSAN